MRESEKAMQDYRATRTKQFRENQDVIKGWRWFAMLNYDTCIACILQHGSEHPSDEEMLFHNDCRCVAMPVTKTFAELGAKGVTETDTSTESGKDWFIRQKRDIQRQVLGNKDFTTWRSGAITLEELAEQCHPGGMIKTISQVKEEPKHICPNCDYKNPIGSTVCNMCSEVLFKKIIPKEFRDCGRVKRGIIGLLLPIPQQRKMVGNCPCCDSSIDVTTDGYEGEFACPTCQQTLSFIGTTVAPA